MKTNQAGQLPIFVEVSDEPIAVGNPFTDPKTGMVKPATSRQICYLHCGQRYPVTFKKKVDPEVGPLRPGLYFMAGSPFKVSEYDGLNFRDSGLDLIPMGDAIEALKPMMAQNGPKLAAAS